MRYIDPSVLRNTARWCRIVAITVRLAGLSAKAMYYEKLAEILERRAMPVMFK